ncbi:MAG TPA: ATP-binding protein [Conexibacter sp.]|nr:ATP-binding protein [Conexibacter sp.]
MSDGVGTQSSSGGTPGRAGAPDDAVCPEVHLLMPALPANVALVRQALAGLTDELGVEPARAADMKIALTEACTNVVVHAYGEEAGPLEVTMAVEHGRLVLSVRDRGNGLHPLPGRDEGSPLGFGLALIASLSDELGLVGGRHGTEVRIAFALDDGVAPPLAIQPSADPAPRADEIVVRLRPPERTAAVLSRVVSLVAARADFSIDRLSDAQIVSDAIAGAAPAYVPNGSLSVAIDEHEGGFDMLVGPFLAGGAQRLIDDTELPGLGSLLERLTDTIDVEQAEALDRERLRVRLLTRD